MRIPVQDLSVPVSPFAWPLAPFSSLSLVLGLFSSVSKSGVAAPDAIAACISAALTESPCNWKLGSGSKLFAITVYPLPGSKILLICPDFSPMLQNCQSGLCKDAFEVFQSHDSS